MEGRLNHHKTMLEIIKFVFSSFWVWLGTVILVGTLAEGVGGFVRITFRRSK